MVEEQGLTVLNLTLEVAQKILGGQLIACYALGSLAHGGFCPLVSDVDIGIIIDQAKLSDLPAVEKLINDISIQVKASQLPLADRLSIFWGTLATLNDPQLGGRFPPLDRLDLIAHGKLLYGKDIRHQLSQPTQQDLVLVGIKTILELLDNQETADEIHNPELLINKGTRRLTKIVLFPIRLFYTAKTGHIGRNEDAANYYAEHQFPGAQLAQQALSWREKAPSNTNEVTQLLQEQLLPIYHCFLDEYILKAKYYRDSDLVTVLENWKKKLIPSL